MTTQNTGEMPSLPSPTADEVAADAVATFDEVVAAHTFHVEDIHEPDIEIAFAKCSCGHWNRQCCTVEGGQSLRGDHLAHVVDAMRETGLASPAPDRVEVCEMVHTEPYDFAECRTHDTTFPLGSECKFHGHLMWEVYADEADEQRGLKVRAEMEAEQAALELDSLKGAIQRVLDDHPVSTAAIAEKIKPLLATDADPLREAQQAAWKFGHSAGTRGLGEDTNPFTPR